MVTVYDLHDEMNPARLIGPVTSSPLGHDVGLDVGLADPLPDTGVPGLAAPLVIAPSPGMGQPVALGDPDGVGPLGLSEVTLREVDQELDPVLWRDVCDPRTPPAPVATGLEAVGLAVHAMEAGPIGRVGQLDPMGLSEAATADLGRSSRLRVLVFVAGAIVALLVLPVVLVFVV